MSSVFAKKQQLFGPKTCYRWVQKGQMGIIIIKKPNKKHHDFSK